ncbi:ATP-dependent Clp protease proteolytic subunit [Zostera marina]|uniref:ATP-dependent Clp protease proteolytic subunit n=1 Tax=Zostera marina TaxID=29655 RepID=A0A0K9PGU5_ZOSMR|nr:ATP-dependent Clp protease proteolytic subunit [Zostera marina]
MVVSFSSAVSSCVHSTITNVSTDSKRSSLSCADKLFVGLKRQSSGAYGIVMPNVSARFHSRVHLSLSVAKKKATSACIKMMPIGTPRVPYRTPGEGTWQWVDLWNALYRDRVIFIGQHIDEEFSNQVLATMLYLDSVESSKKLYLYINGPGGDLTPCMSIFDTMQSLKSPVGTQCVGFAYNLAGFLLAAGEKGSRAGMPLSRVALQSPAGAARGQADDIENETKELLRVRDYLFQELAKKTGQPLDKIYKDLSRFKRFTAQEALEYGLIDRVLRPVRIKADAPRKEQSGPGLG